MSINRLYDTWKTAIVQLHPHERITRVRNLVWMMIGMYKSKSVHLSKIAGEIPGQANNLSIAQRMSRFVKNKAVNVKTWYEPVAKAWIAGQAETTGEVRLILDGTKIGFGYQLLMVSLAFRRRAVPIAWTWVRKPHGKGRSSTSTHVALLRLVHRLVPGGVAVLVVGDSEFGDVPVMQQLEEWDWHYALRQKGTIQVKLPGTTAWRNFRDLLTKPGQRVWIQEAFITLKHVHVANLFAYWQVGEEEPWLIVTDLPTPAATKKAYGRRMWIEEMFGDFKSNGVDLETTHLRDPERLNRVTLAVALLCAWLLATGAQVIKNGWRAAIDRADRRDLSVFQIGFRFIRRCLTNDYPFPFRLYPPLPKLSGS